MDKFTGKYPIKLKIRLRMNPSLRIRIPELAFAVPALQFQITVIVKTIHHLRWRLFGLTT